MRVSDRPDYPRAKVAGTYGCCHCGNYARLTVGVKLKCSLCRSAAPLVIVASAADQRGSDTPVLPVSTPEMGTGSGSSEPNR